MCFSHDVQGGLGLRQLASQFLFFLAQFFVLDFGGAAGGLAPAAARSDAGQLTSSGSARPTPRKEKSPEQAELERLRKEKARLDRQNAAMARKIKQTEAALDIMGKGIALGNGVRERGCREFVNTCRAGTCALLAEHLPITASYALTGLSRSGF
ncbi:hypothetical protein GCM10010191_87660 [Actinomadura vinacea]|uniref:Uncharacterized protein n=1 Tax=Actinomadura vinacea TaxID=115336 RepID=A0ABN3KF62_9ACTN